LTKLPDTQRELGSSGARTNEAEARIEDRNLR
jgi:hypothetical protein